MNQDKPVREVEIKINCGSIDQTIEKANRLVELLKEASSLIDSLSRSVSLES